METSAERKMTALIFTGGYCNTDRVRRYLPEDPGLTIAADSGLRTAEKLGIVPDIVMGDFDSYTARLPDSVPVYSVPAEKDVTDTMLACDYAAERGFCELLIVGGTGGRIDHELSNVLYLERLRRRGIRALLTDGDNSVRVLLNEAAEIPDEGGYFSVFALDRCIVTETGCKYPVDRAELVRENPFAVSNEVAGACARVEVKGVALLVTSRK